MFPSNQNQTTTSDTPVEVEVSLDMFSQLYSIVVTEAASLQSIVSVRSSQVDETAAQAADETDDAASDRLADCLRPSSPTPRSRHSGALERGRSRSLPPPMTHNAIVSSRGTSKIIRDISCPPMTTVRTDERRHRSSRMTTTRKSRKPNLVSKTAARTRRLFAGRQRQIIPSL